MNVGRVVLVVTCLVVTALGVWFALVSWDDANRLAGALSALGAVAAVGVAIWAALPSRRVGGQVRVAKTGNARASGGKAITGFLGRAIYISVEAMRTGDATASGDGHAVSGVEIN